MCYLGFIISYLGVIISDYLPIPQAPRQDAEPDVLFVNPLFVAPVTAPVIDVLRELHVLDEGKQVPKRSSCIARPNLRNLR